MAVLLGANIAKAEATYVWDQRLSFTLPEGWIEVPADVRKQRMAESEKVLTKPRSFDCAHVYLLSNADWFSYPYIIIAPQSGRVPEAELQKWPTIDMSKSLTETHEWSKGILQNIDIGRLSYDPATKKSWSEGAETLASGPTIRYLLMMQVTQTGVVSFYFYATSEQYSHFKPLFLQIANSVTPDSEIAYRSNSETWLMSGSVLEWGVRGALLALVVMLCSWIGRRLCA
jgi:hypothetical protein